MRHPNLASVCSTWALVIVMRALARHPVFETPAEMHFYIPELRALTAAENANNDLHNLCTLCSVKVRDARGWASYLDQTIERRGDQAEVLGIAIPGR